MKFFSSRLIVAIIAFLVGVCAVWLWLLEAEKQISEGTSITESQEKTVVEVPAKQMQSELSLPEGKLTQTDIRKVDFKNFTYNLSCGGADKVSPVTVKNGEYSGIKDSIADGDVEVYLKITDVIFGDINGDRKDEAIVLYSCGSGASYVYISGLIFTTKNDKPILLTELEGGNKGDGGFHEVKIERNLLVTERNQLPTAGSPCCPAYIETTKYKLKGRKLVKVGKQTSRKILSSS